jgi:hypothetical protein
MADFVDHDVPQNCAQGLARSDVKLRGRVGKDFAVAADTVAGEVRESKSIERQISGLGQDPEVQMSWECDGAARDELARIRKV